MKQILLACALLFSFKLSSQVETKQPKLRIYTGFLSTKYELGDKDVKPKDVRLHLEKTSPEAYYHWRKAESAAVTALVGSIIGGVGVIYGAVAEENEQKAAGYLVGAAGFTVCLIGVLSSGSRQEKAANIYNKKFGY